MSSLALSRGAKIAVGVFLTLAVALVSGFLFLIGDRRQLFDPHVILTTEFDHLANVSEGAQVRVAGALAGELEAVSLPERPGQSFRLHLRIAERMLPVVRQDSSVSIETSGLLGEKYIAVSAGSPTAAAVGDGFMLDSSETSELEDLASSLETTLSRAENLIEASTSGVETLTAATHRSLGGIDEFVESVGPEVTETTRRGRRVLAEVESLAREIRAGEGSLGRLVADDQLYREMLEASRAARASGERLDAVLADVRELLEEVRGDLEERRVVAETAATLAATREAMEDVSEVAESLKRRWPFGKLFNQRGYYDLDALSVADYRADALSAEHRLVERRFVEADALFAGAVCEAPGAENRLTLSPEGATLLDDAAAATLDAAGRPAILIIEGYADRGADGCRYLTSLHRAMAVRDYLVDRFLLRRARTIALPVVTPQTGDPVRLIESGEGIVLAAYTSDARP